MALPAPHDRLLQCLAAMQKTASAKQLERAGFAKQRLSDICRFAYENTAAGKKRLAPLFRNGMPDWQSWPDIPLLSKWDVMNDRQSHIAPQLPAEAGRPRDGWTAGTTGHPLHFLSTELASLADQQLNQRFFRDWKLSPGGTFVQIAITRGPADQKASGHGWHLDDARGPWHRIDVGTDTDEQLDRLVALQPSVLKLYPLSLAVLCERAIARQIRLRLELVICGGNIVTPDMREQCREVFGCDVADTYGAEETGLIAVECPHCRQMHVMEESIMLEVLRDDNSQAIGGETGRTVVTSFYNFAMPLVRYDLEDHVETVRDPPACAQGRLTLSRVRGRSTSAFRLRDGRINWPFVPASAIHAIGGIKHFQFVQESLTGVCFNYVGLTPNTNIASSAIQDIVDRYIDPSLTARVQRVESIPREKDMKYMLFKGLEP